MSAEEASRQRALLELTNLRIQRSSRKFRDTSETRALFREDSLEESHFSEEYPRILKFAAGLNNGTHSRNNRSLPDLLPVEPV